MVVGAALLLAGGWLAAPWIVERVLIGHFAAQGFPDTTLDVRRVGPFETRIEQLRLATVSAERVILRYTPLAALRGDLYSLTLEGLALQGGARETASAMARAEAALRTASGLRIAHIEFGEAKVALGAPGGDWNATLRGSLVQTPSGALEGAVSVVATSIAGAFGGEFRLSPDDAGRTAVRLQVREAVLRLPGLTLEGLAGAVSVARSDGPLPLVDLDVQAGGRAPDGSGLERARLRLVSTGGTALASLAGIDLDGRRFTVESGFDVAAEADGSIALRLARPGSIAFLDRPVRGATPLSLDARIMPGDAPALRLIADADSLRLVHALRLALRPTMLATAAGPARIEDGTLAIDGSLGGDGARGRSELRIPRLVVPARALRAEDVALVVHWEEGPLRFDLTARSLASTAAPPWFAPLPLALSGNGGPAALSFTGRLGGSPVAIDIEGEAAGPGVGRAALRLRPLDLGAAGDLTRLSPALAAIAEAPHGQVAGRAEVAWTQDGLSGGGRLLLREVAATLPIGRVERVNGVVALDRLVPPTTAGPQTLSVGLVDMGLPLTDGTVTFRLDQGGPVLEDARFSAAGGTVRATDALSGGRLTMAAAALNLGLAAAVSGNLMLEIDQERLTARLADDANGLEFALDRPHRGTPTMRAAVDGRPHDLPDDLASRIARDARQAADAHRVPEATLRQMQAYGEP
ncbi:hypothetical protein STHU_19810 [Allostella humosa]|nr:hypothetical protein STHU_19810 [Stella humosa]